MNIGKTLNITRISKYVYVSTFFLCATVLSRFTQDQSLTIRHAIWSASALILFIAYKNKIPSCTLLWCLVGYFVLAGLSVFWAMNQYESIYEISKILLMVLFFVYSWNFMKDNREFFITSMTVLACLLSGYGLYEILFTNHGVNCMGTMPVRNVWASAQVLLLPFCIYEIKKHKWAVIPSLLIVINLVLLRNRASLLAMFAAGTAWVIFTKRYKLLFFIGMIGVVCLLVPKMANTDSLHTRWGVWTATMRLFEENPFFGIGINNWQIEVPKYSQYFLEKDVWEKLFYFRPHNDFLWALSETGLFGLFCYAGIFISAAYYSVKSRNILTLSLLVIYYVIASFSFPKERAFHSLVYVAILAMSVYDVKVIKLPVKYVCVLLLLGCTSVFSICHYSERYMRRMQFARDRKQYADVLRYASHISPIRSVDMVGIPVKWYTGEAQYFLGNNAEAIADSMQALRLNPNNILVLDRMGEINQGLGDIDAAMHCYKRALAIKPDFGSSKRKLALLMEKKNVNDRERR